MNKNNNKYIIYGKNSCFNFLSINHNYKIDNIYIKKNNQFHRNDSLYEAINKTKNNINYLDSHIFKNKFDYKHTQGIVIEFSGKIEKNIEDNSSYDKNTCIIIADQIEDPQNLGQIIRTSECSGIKGIVIPKHRSVHLTNSVLQVSQGAFLYIDIYIENNLINVINYLKKEGFWIIGVENSTEAQEWYKLDYKGKIAIVIGSEGKGIRELVKKSCDFLATIPMQGKINSLNVTAALSAILFERQRQLEITK